MSKREIFSVNGDVIRTFEHDDLTDVTTIGTFQDVAPYLDQNKHELKNEVSGQGDGLQKIASIPLTIIEQWRKELGSDPLHLSNRGWLMKRLQDPAYSSLRTKSGRYV